MDEIRNQRIESQIDTVKKIAGAAFRKIYGRIDYEELVSVGYLALVQAVDHFDESRGCVLKTFIGQRIWGAMIDFMRNEDPLSRNHRKEVGPSFNASQQFDEEGEEGGFKISSLPSYFIDPEASAIRSEIRNLVDVYPTKKDRDRAVVRMSFLEEKAQAEIAKELDISPGRVSQIISDESSKLREYLAA